MAVLVYTVEIYALMRENVRVRETRQLMARESVMSEKKSRRRDSLFRKSTLETMKRKGRVSPGRKEDNRVVSCLAGFSFFW